MKVYTIGEKAYMATEIKEQLDKAISDMAIGEDLDFKIHRHG